MMADANRRLQPPRRQVAEQLPDVVDFDDVDFADYEQSDEDDEEWNSPRSDAQSADAAPEADRRASAAGNAPPPNRGLSPPGA